MAIPTFSSAPAQWVLCPVTSGTFPGYSQPSIRRPEPWKLLLQLQVLVCCSPYWCHALQLACFLDARYTMFLQLSFPVLGQQVKTWLSSLGICYQFFKLACHKSCISPRRGRKKKLMESFVFHLENHSKLNSWYSLWYLGCRLSQRWASEALRTAECFVWVFFCQKTKALGSVKSLGVGGGGKFGGKKNIHILQN